MKSLKKLAALLIAIISLGSATGTAQDKVSEQTYNHWLRSARMDIELLNSRITSQQRELTLTVKGWEETKTELEKEKNFRNDLQKGNADMRLSLIECRKNFDMIVSDHKIELANRDKLFKKQKRKGTWATVSGMLSGIGIGLLAGFILAK